MTLSSSTAVRTLFLSIFLQPLLRHSLDIPPPPFALESVSISKDDDLYRFIVCRLFSPTVVFALTYPICQIPTVHCEFS
jgi:hypothetical protein